MANGPDLGAIAAAAARFDGEQQAGLDAQGAELMASMPGLATRLLDFFEVLPAAMIAAQGAELERLAAIGGPDDGRVAAAEARLAALQAAESLAIPGRARAARALAQLNMPGRAFWGFVSDEKGQPVAGMTVRLSARGNASGSSARTAEDGYFRIALPDDTGPGAASMSAIGTPAGGQGKDATFTVQFVNAAGAIVFEDQVPLAGGGSAYREYRLGVQVG